MKYFAHLLRLIAPPRLYCEPATALAVSSLAISATSAVAQGQAQNAQAKAETARQQSLSAANNEVAADQTAQLRLQQAQSAEARARENEKARLASQRAQATARVAAGEAGVTGNSVDAVLTEYDANLGRFREASIRQATFGDQAITDQIAAVRTNTRYANLQINAPVAGANVAALGLSFAKDALSTYGNYNPSAFKKAPTPKPVG